MKNLHGLVDAGVAAESRGPRRAALSAPAASSPTIVWIAGSGCQVMPPAARRRRRGSTPRPSRRPRPKSRAAAASGCTPSASPGTSSACASEATTRRGEASAITVSGETGQIASLPRQRLADHRRGEGRGGAVRPARPHDDGRQAQRPAVDKPLAPVIVDQELADRLLRAVGALRRQRRVVADRVRQRAAINRERAGEDRAWVRAERAAGVEHGAGAVEIDPVAEIGVGLGLAADDRGEMEDRVGAGADQRPDRGAVGDVAGDERGPACRQAAARPTEHCRTVPARRLCPVREAAAPAAARGNRTRL